jgi:hypothetical protein
METTFTRIAVLRILLFILLLLYSLIVFNQQPIRKNLYSNDVSFKPGSSAVVINAGNILTGSPGTSSNNQ